MRYIFIVSSLTPPHLPIHPTLCSFLRLSQNKTKENQGTQRNPTKGKITPKSIMTKHAEESKMEHKVRKILLSLFCVVQLFPGVGPSLKCG